jgi:AcrR family transcriptional regulator
MTEPLAPLPITVPLPDNAQQEGEWLRSVLLRWLDAEYLPEPINAAIAERVAQVFTRQRMEGEDDLGSLVMAILTELQAFDFSQSFYGEFAVANAVGDLICDRLGIDRCCGRSSTLDANEI